MEVTCVEGGRVRAVEGLAPGSYWHSTIRAAGGAQCAHAACMEQTCAEEKQRVKHIRFLCNVSPREHSFLRNSV